MMIGIIMDYKLRYLLIQYIAQYQYLNSNRQKMSLFYKQSQNQNKNPIENNESIVKPYAPQAPPSTFYSKKVQPKPMIQQQPRPSTFLAADPKFPKRQQQPSSAQPEAGLRKSILLANSEDDKQSWLTKCCSCANLQSYKRFFSVTNQDVMKRIGMNLQFWSTGFFGPEQQYDFYGPFWIYTTVVFCLSAVPNILLYQGANNFQYNFSIVSLAFGFIYLEGFIFPAILTFILKLLGVQCTYIQNICIYGYSMCAVIICLLICSINVCLLHIVLLAYAFGTKAWFILNNMLTHYNIPIPKKALIAGLVVGEAVLQFFVVKVLFIICAPQSTSSSTTQAQHLLMDNILYHARTFVS